MEWTCYHPSTPETVKLLPREKSWASASCPRAFSLKVEASIISPPPLPPSAKAQQGTRHSPGPSCSCVRMPHVPGTG